MMVERRNPLRARIGVMAVGHHTYWGQFEGFRDQLMAKYDILLDKLRGRGVEIVDFGLVDKAEGAYDVLPRIKAADLDLLIVDMVTYATSSTFGAIAREASIPIVLAVLQHHPALDYVNGTTQLQLYNDDFCSVPEFCGVAVRLGRPAPHVILGMLEGDPVTEAELDDWCGVARILHDLRRARIGHMGHVLEAMLDMHTDPTAVTATFGCHVVQCEPDEILRRYRSASAAAVEAKKSEILGFFDTPDPGADPVAMKLTPEHLDTAARVAVALDAFITDRRLDGLAYYYEAEAGSEMQTVVTNLIVGNSLLCAAGFPMCGEYDIKTCLAMLAMDRLDAGGSFAEFHVIDYPRGSILVGHDGPHHINIAEGRPVLRSLKTFHGKPGSGASVEFRIKTGPITMLSVGVTGEGRFKFIIAEGESREGPIPPTGNTNTHGHFKPDIRTFLKRWVAEGPTHHFALGIGRRASALAKLAEVLGVEAAVVAEGEAE